jgi:hypothetical protein
MFSVEHFSKLQAASQLGCTFFNSGALRHGEWRRRYGLTAALRLLVQPYDDDDDDDDDNDDDDDDDDDDDFFFLFQVMAHRRNETDRGKPKYSGRNLSQCQLVYHKSHTKARLVSVRASLFYREQLM